MHKPLELPSGARARYVDYKTLAQNRERYPELAGEAIVTTDVVDDGFVLRRFEEESLDFIVANHALEHSPDPYGTLLRWAKKTRSGGVLYFAVPIADKCFDSGRALTSVEHLLLEHQDFLQGNMDRLLFSAYSHLLEFMRVSDSAIRVANGLVPLSESEATDFATRLICGLTDRLDAAPATYDDRITAFVDGLNKVYDLHYHAFSPSSLQRFLREVCARETGLLLERLEKSGSGEAIAIVRVR
jgi:SAM-dependent methyltransferase